MSEIGDDLEHEFGAALAAGDLDEALSLGRRLGSARRGGLALKDALGLTVLMVRRNHPRSEEAIERWRLRLQKERSPRRCEGEIADAALRGLAEPEASTSFFCERVLRQMIGDSAQ